MICRRVLGCTVGWESSDPELLTEIRTLTGLLPEDHGDPDFWFSFEPIDDQVELRQDGAFPTCIAREHAFSTSMQWLLAELILRTDLCPLHAGMVERDGAAMLLPAMSGRGKSTLTTALLGAGFSFGSDELAPFDHAGSVVPYPVPIRIREDAMERFGKLPSGVRLWSTRIFRKAAWTRFLMPSHACPPRPLPVRLIVFPTGYHAEEEPRLVRVPAGQATMKLLSEKLGPSPTAQQFRTCADLVEATPCYDVIAGDPHRTAARLATLWEDTCMSTTIAG